jgi:hypothetical protein
MNSTTNRFATYSMGLLLAACLAGCADEDATDDAEDTSEDALTGLTSAYTPLREKPELDFSHCQQFAGPVADNPQFHGAWDCGGMGGYSAFAISEGAFDYIVLQTPTGKFINLDVLSHVPEHPAKGTLGPKAEWRGRFVSAGHTDPSTLIFRYMTPRAGFQNRSFLLVAKVTPDAACIYATVDGNVANGNQKARDEAAKVGSVTCPATGVGGPVTHVSAWAGGDVRSCPRSSCAVVGSVAANKDYSASCWTTGETITTLGYTNEKWVKLLLANGAIGYVSGIYLRGDETGGVHDQCAPEAGPSFPFLVGMPTD